MDVIGIRLHTGTALSHKFMHGFDDKNTCMGPSLNLKAGNEY
jgi:hypothetical protein